MTQENLDKKIEEKTEKVERKTERRTRAPRKNTGVTRNARTTRSSRTTKNTKEEKIEKGEKTEETTVKRERKTENRIGKRTEKRETRKSRANNNIFKKGKLKIIPLGGLHEVGKNITVFEYEDEIIVVDCGLSFPEDDMLGIDLVIPDITYLQKNVDKIKGLIITHGHEDHIGSVPYLLKQINIPVYAPRLAMGLIRNKLEEHKILRSSKLIEVMQGETITLGKNFKVEFIRSTHSIPDSVMLAIKTPVGTILHTGDFKVDYTPIDGKIMDLGRIAELGNEGILALMSDSTNAERKGFTMSESSIGPVFDNLFDGCTKRIVVATFASNVHRVQQIVNSAVKYKRKIAVCGRSMINMINTARELGYIDCPEDLFIDIDMMSTYNDEQLVIITTGSQGETMSALTRMAAGDHRKVKITPNDLVIISANPIPGNEKLVSKVIDDLMQIGAEVVYSALADVHVSGHACQEEQKLIFALAKPKFFIPVHGEYRQLIAHAETAQSMGIPAKNIVLMENGRVVELSEDEIKLAGMVPNGRVLVDGLGVGDVGNIVLRDRQHLSQDGLIVIVLTMDSSTGEVVAGPDVISRGFVYVRESENLMDEVKSVVRHEIKKCEEKEIRDWSTIKSTVRENLRDYIFVKTKRNPMIIPIIMEV
ncbi:ribonuclease J [bacterium]|nr:ribonuclease J [bacterium]